MVFLFERQSLSHYEHLLRIWSRVTHKERKLALWLKQVQEHMEKHYFGMFEAITSITSVAAYSGVRSSFSPLLVDSASRGHKACSKR